MENIYKCLTNYKSDDLKNIVHDKMQPHSYKYSKINLYNKNIKHNLPKILIKTPKLKIFNNVSPSKSKIIRSCPMKLLLAPNVNDVKKFYFFIRKLERKVGFIIRKIKKTNNITTKSVLIKNDKFPPIITIKLPLSRKNGCVNFNFHIYNHRNKRVNINVIQSGNYMSAFIELSEIWINQNNDFGFNWNVLQMKIYPQYDLSICQFDDINSDDEDIVDDIECYHCLYCPNNHIQTHFYCKNINHNNSNNIPPPPPPPPVVSININKDRNNKKKNIATNNINFVPSINDLLSIKLKPINKKKDIDKSNSVFAPSLNAILDIKEKLKKRS